MRCPPVVALVAWRAVWIAAACQASNLASAAESADFYVSPRGNDQWSGTVAAPKPDGSDGPVATVERAQKLVRELRAAQPERICPLVVSLRGGMYTLAGRCDFRLPTAAARIRLIEANQNVR